MSTLDENLTRLDNEIGVAPNGGAVAVGIAILAPLFACAIASAALWGWTAHTPPPAIMVNVFKLLGLFGLALCGLWFGSQLRKPRP